MVPSLRSQEGTNCASSAILYHCRHCWKVLQMPPVYGKHSQRVWHDACIVIPINLRWFPEMGLPSVIIHFHGIFHYKPSILGYPQDYGNLYHSSMLVGLFLIPNILGNIITHNHQPTGVLNSAHVLIKCSFLQPAGLSCLWKPLRHLEPLGGLHPSRANVLSLTTCGRAQKPRRSVAGRHLVYRNRVVGPERRQRKGTNHFTSIISLCAHVLIIRFIYIYICIYIYIIFI